jgi:hypothetical protein
MFAGAITFSFSVMIATCTVSADLQLTETFPVKISCLLVCVLAEKSLNMSNVTFLVYLGKACNTTVTWSMN